MLNLHLLVGLQHFSEDRGMPFLVCLEVATLHRANVALAIRNGEEWRLSNRREGAKQQGQDAFHFCPSNESFFWLENEDPRKKAEPADRSAMIAVTTITFTSSLNSFPPMPNTTAHTTR